MASRPLMQVDVFTDRPHLGNPVAVVLDAGGLDAKAMQAIARWTDLSETTFVLAPDGLVDVRYDADGIGIGGAAVVCISGEIVT